MSRIPGFVVATLLTLSAAPSAALRHATRLQEPATDVTGGTVRGRVETQASDPVAGVEVVLTIKARKRVEELGRAVTDAEGRFVYSSDHLTERAKASPRRMQIDAHVVADGYLPARKKCKHPDGGWDVLLSLEPGTLVRGRVIDPAGQPVSSARVQLELVQAREEPPARDDSGVKQRTVQCGTDRDGRFAIGARVPGSFHLSARKNALGTARLELEVEQAVGTLALPDLALVSLAEIAGVLRTSTGVPLPQVLVCAEQVGGEEVDGGGERPASDGLAGAQSWTDDAGRFLIQGLRDGRYTLYADFRGHKDRTLDRRSRRDFSREHLELAPLARQGDPPGIPYEAKGDELELELVLDACLVQVVAADASSEQRRGTRVGLIEGVDPDDPPRLEGAWIATSGLKGAPASVTLRGTPGCEAVIAVFGDPGEDARGKKRHASRGPSTFHPVQIATTPGVQRVEIRL